MAVMFSGDSQIPTAVIPSLNGTSTVPPPAGRLRSFLPSFNVPVASRLLQYVKLEESEKKTKGAEKEIKSLVKRLRKTDSLQELEKALSTNGGTPTKCVTIGRILDGGSASGHRTGLPHVTYCRLWRWPDLQTHYELLPVENCEFSYNFKKDDVCINPYHYVRRTAPTMNPILVPTQLPPVNGLSLFSPPPPQNIDHQPPSVDPPLPAEETPPPAYSEVASSIGSPPDQSVYSGVGSPIMSPGSVLSAGSPQSFVPVLYTEPPFWCSINYHEMSSRIGEPFQAISTSITVDGGTDTCTTERFCVGGLCNVNRDHPTIQVRKHIGQGVRLLHFSGEVHVEVLSKQAVFVQAQSANLRSSWHKATVVKVPPGCMMNLFDSQDFAQRLTVAVSQGFEAVNELQKLCTIRMSFVKGWGTDYRRTNVTDTPCWIEIHLNGPLQWLDKVETQMGGPSGIIHSDT